MPGNTKRVNIIGLDPGGTTGVCIYHNMSKRTTDYHAQFEFLHLGPGDHHRALWRLLSDNNPTHIVCERFDHRPHQHRENVVLDSREYIGVVKLFVEMTSTPLELQNPMKGTGGNFWSDDKLKTLTLWKANMPHAMDALRHVLYFISFKLGDDSYIKMLRKTGDSEQ